MQMKELSHLLNELLQVYSSAFLCKILLKSTTISKFLYPSFGGFCTLLKINSLPTKFSGYRVYQLYHYIDITVIVMCLAYKHHKHAELLVVFKFDDAISIIDVGRLQLIRISR